MRRKMTDEERANKQLKLTIKMYLLNRDMTQKQLAKTIDMPLATFKMRSGMIQADFAEVN